MGIYEFKESDAFDFARFNGANAKRIGNELSFQLCPYCKGGQRGKDKNTFSINLVTGQFKCLRSSCSNSGNMISLARDFHFSLSKDVDEYYFKRSKYRTYPEVKQKIKTPQKIIEWVKSRGISEETAKKYELSVHKDNDNWMIFPFFDENEELKLIKYRNIEYNGVGPKEWSDKNCKPILFGMKQCNTDNKTLIICEGMMDSLAVDTAGFENAISVPNGMNGFTWIPHCWDWWCQFETLIVFGDNEKGKITLLDVLSKRFPGTVKHIQDSDYMGCKDANEILMKHGISAVKNAINNAVEIPVKQVVQLCDVKRRDVSKLPKFRLGFKRIESYLDGYMYGGQLMIMTGKRGSGKSIFVNQIAVSALSQGKKVFTYSGELPDWQYKSWIDFQIAGRNNIIERQDDFGNTRRFITNTNQFFIDEWYKDRFFLYDNNAIDETDDELVDLVTTIEKSVMQYGIDLVIIDNLMTALDVDMNANEFRAQSKFVKKVSKLAKKLDVSIILVAHPKKNSITDDENDAISGSADITNLADIVMTFKRDKEEDNHSLITISKNRWSGALTKKGIDVYYDVKSKRIIDKAGNFDALVGWEKYKPESDNGQQVNVNIEDDGFISIGEDGGDMPF